MRSNPLIGEGNVIPKLQKLKQDYENYVKDTSNPAYKSKLGISRRKLGQGANKSIGISPNIPVSRHAISNSGNQNFYGDQSRNRNTFDQSNNSMNRPMSKADSSHNLSDMRQTINYSGLETAPKLLPESFNPTFNTPQMNGGKFDQMNHQYEPFNSNMPPTFTPQMQYSNFMTQSPYSNMPNPYMQPPQQFAPPAYTPQYSQSQLPAVQQAQPPAHPSQHYDNAQNAAASTQNLHSGTSFESVDSMAKTMPSRQREMEIPADYNFEARYKEEEKNVLKEFLKKQMLEK